MRPFKVDPVFSVQGTLKSYTPYFGFCVSHGALNGMVGTPYNNGPGAGEGQRELAARQVQLRRYCIPGNSQTVCRSE